MMGNNTHNLLPIVLGSVFASLFAICGLSVNVSAEDEPDYLLGNLTNEKNVTKEQKQQIFDKISNYWSTIKNEANGNATKFGVLVFEDMAKRKIIDEKAKQGFLSFIASIPKAHVLPGTFPGNLTIPGVNPPVGVIPGNITLPGNNTTLLKDLDTSSAILDGIAKNNSDSQTVVLMTDILKKGVADIKTSVSGNVTDTGMIPMEADLSTTTPGEFAGSVLCAGLFVLGPGVVGAVNAAECIAAVKTATDNW